MTTRQEQHVAEARWRSTESIDRDLATRGVAYVPANELRGDVHTWRNVGLFLAGSACGALILLALLLFVAVAR